MGQTDSGQKRQRWDKQIAVRRDRETEMGQTDSGQMRHRDRDGTNR